MKVKFIALLSVLLIVIFYFSQRTLLQKKDAITIGSKAFTESIILGELLASLLEIQWNQKVDRKFNMGGTQVVFEALKRGDIDIYPEYTGTGLVSILDEKSSNEPLQVYKKVQSQFLKKWQIIWSQPIGFNNTYAIAVSKDDLRFSNIVSISDISKMRSNLRYGAPHEFMERKDGHLPFTRTYNLHFKEDQVFSMESGLMYSALINKEIDLGVVYSTDGRIQSSNLKLLKDDKSFFPPYEVAYIAPKSLLDTHVAVRHIFSQVKDLISEKEMIEMNDQVDRLRYSPKQVVLQFLYKKGWVHQAPEISSSHQKNLWAYFVNHQQYLLKLTKEHLMLVFIALIISIGLGVPMGILALRYSWLERIIFPFVNTIQTIPSLALLGFLIPVLGIGAGPALLAFFLYSLLPIVRNTYSGIHNIEQRYIEIAQGLGLTRFQILRYIELPLAFPSILSGIRVAAVIVVGMATLATLIGAGGLGDPIFRGISTLDNYLILLGAIPAALLGICMDQGIELIEKFCFNSRYWLYIRQK